MGVYTTMRKQRERRAAALLKAMLVYGAQADAADPDFEAQWAVLALGLVEEIDGRAFAEFRVRRDGTRDGTRYTLKSYVGTIPS